MLRWGMWVRIPPRPQTSIGVPVLVIRKITLLIKNHISKLRLERTNHVFTLRKRRSAINHILKLFENKFDKFKYV
jgi:hypothetical protein